MLNTHIQLTNQKTVDINYRNDDITSMMSRLGHVDLIHSVNITHNYQMNGNSQKLRYSPETVTRINLRFRQGENAEIYVSKVKPDGYVVKPNYEMIVEATDNTALKTAEGLARLLIE